jgi:hypothetical protein
VSADEAYNAAVTCFWRYSREQDRREAFQSAVLRLYLLARKGELRTGGAHGRV